MVGVQPARNKRVKSDMMDAAALARSGSHSSLVRAVVQDLGRSIVRGDFETNTPFPTEAELCSRYGIARPAVREALKTLTGKGLLESRRRLGTRVLPENEWNLLDPDLLSWMLERPFSLRLLIEFTEGRLAFEPVAAALAAASATKSQREAIRAATERMIADGGTLESDIAFHTAILDASNNKFLRQLKSLTQAGLRFSLQYTKLGPKHRRSVPEAHSEIAKAVVSGKVEKSERLMREHVRKALDLLRAQAPKI